MQFKSFITLLLVLFICIPVNSQSELSKNGNNTLVIQPLSRSLFISTELGMALASTDYRNTSPNINFRFYTEYFFPTITKHFLGVKIGYNYSILSGKDDRELFPDFNTSVNALNGAISYGYQVAGNVYPFVSVGLSYLNFEPEDIDGNPLPNNKNNIYSKSSAAFNIELGSKIFLTDNVSLNISSRYNHSFNDYLDDKLKGANDDVFLEFGAGISFGFFVEVDKDNDGVKDSKDQCLETPENVEVNQFGCPKDSDRDGIPDYLDMCSNTPARVEVDERGCPLDSDKDGVPDFADRCPNTPEKIKVNRYGCPNDSDFDGVPDFIDQCPNTLRGVPVTKDGCPSDNDNDGVPDYLDKCPQTKEGLKVDNSGCPDLPKEFRLGTTAIFRTGEAVLLPDAYKDLDRVVEVISNLPNSKWRIEGHTDNVGNPQFNKELSLRRAEAVFNYFISKGFSKDRFQVLGYGEEYPIAENSSAEGRSLNRRVAIIFVE